MAPFVGTAICVIKRAKLGTKQMPRLPLTVAVSLLPLSGVLIGHVVLACRYCGFLGA